MAVPTQFRQYLIAQDGDGKNVEVVRTGDQVGVLAFDTRRLAFVHCHVLLDPLESRRNFDERAQKFKACGHPRLARLIESGEDEGSAYYVTANVDGETLRRYLSRHEQIPVWLAMRLTALALEAVRAALEMADFLPLQLMDVLRIVQTGPQDFLVMLADYRLAEPGGAKPAARSRVTKGAFEKHEQFLGVFFLERLQTGASMREAMLSAGDFVELLENLLASCAQHVAGGIGSVLRALGKSTPSPAPGELAAALKPRPLVGSLMPGFTEVARSVAAKVRIHSQKLDAAHPYAMRGTLTRGGQEVVVEQVPLPRLAGNGPAEMLRQVLQVPKIGKFPNLVPVNFVEQTDGVLCMAETAVEGVALSDLLAARGTLDAQEVYLVLAGMDAALAQLEKTNLDTKRLRLEDIYLFTGFSKAPVHESGLLHQRLNEWPGFSIVLRAHPCMGSMSGRGTDPAMLLPAELRPSSGTEPLWHGAWMAALGCFLSGMSSGEAARHATGSEDMDATFRMFEEELARGRKGAPPSRSEFLSRYAKVMENHDVVELGKSGGFWAELSGAGAAQGRAAEISRSAVAAPVEQKPVLVEKIGAAEILPEKPTIGFAEALIQQAHLRDLAESVPRGLQPMSPELRDTLDDDVYESSWRPMHQETPLWLRALMFAGGSLALGAALAHLSGRAKWQDPRAGAYVRPAAAEVAPPAAQPTIDLPVATPAVTTSQGSKSPGPKMPPTASPPLAAANLEPRTPGSKGASTPAATPPATPVAADPALTAKLVELRKTGGKLPPELRGAVTKAARSGSTEAMLALGRMNLRGEAGAVDERSAFTWFEKANSAGNTAATVPLAECYLQGWGTAPDLALAVNLLSKAAATGESAAKDLLGVCYARGFGVARDDAKAFALCSEAYEAGSATACGNLGALYLHGQGVAQSAERAVQLFGEGARRGHAESMLLYAQSLEYGTGIPADRVQAEQWYQHAARLGIAEAANWCRQKGVAY